MRWWVATLGFIWSLPFAADAADVTLRHRGGETEFTGALLGFDGEVYRLDTAFGVLSLSARSVACIGEDCPDPAAIVPTFVVSGMAPLSRAADDLVETFARIDGLSLLQVFADGDTRTYEMSGSGEDVQAFRLILRMSEADEAFADLVAHEADAAVSEREMLPEERARLLEVGLGDSARRIGQRVLAMDAIVVLAHPDVALAAIGVQELRRALAGEIDNWARIGGPDLPLVAIRGGIPKDLGPVLSKVFEGPDNLSDHGGAGSEGIADLVSRSPGALALGRWSERGMARVLPLGGACGARISATGESLRNEDYPLTIDLHLVRPAKRLPGLGRRFLAFLASDAAAEVLEDAGFAASRPLLTPLEDQGARLAAGLTMAEGGAGLSALQRFARTVEGAQRLSVSFRFTEGSTELDPPSVDSLSTLMRLLGTEDFRDHEIVLAGFSDGIGSFAGNLKLSGERAKSVEQAIRDELSEEGRAALRISSHGFGEILPMACDDAAWGRNANRRVEVWIR